MGWDNVVDLILKLQNLWYGIDGRCNHPKSRSYKDYGAKGITLCEERSKRQGSVKFIKWSLTHGYKIGLDIDRRDNSKGYSPENCRFIPRRENCWNKSNNVMITYRGETKCRAAWGVDKRCKVPSNQFQQRMVAGWSMIRALTQPLGGQYGTKRKTKR